MALMPRLEVRQSQSLTLTPQLMQSIRLLQLGHLELSAFVDLELERNPLLEQDEGREADIPETPETAADAGDVTDSFEQGDVIGTAGSIAEQYDTDVSNVFPEQVGQDSQSQSKLGRREGPSMVGVGEAPDIDSFVAAEIDLSMHLREQVALILKAPAERMIAQHLIDSLNEAGYLTLDCTQIAEQLGTDSEAVETVLKKVQVCDPLGVFARSVSECLAIQLHEKDRLDPLMVALLDNLDLVAEHDIAGLCRIVGVDREDIADMLGELRDLDPKPGRAFDGAPVQAVVPDVYVKAGNAGAWAIELNSDILPRVLVNRTYYAKVIQKTKDQREKTFLVDCLQTASWLTKSLDQRAQTILKVATEIVSQQDRFLLHGITHLKPMTLKTVADAIEMHESTVSRVTANKYIATPRGLFEMKYFFTTALASASGGDEHSAESVRHWIRLMIDGEDVKRILSDDRITEMLKNQHSIDVARRTVAKYREAMHIPSSVIRRRQKRALALVN